MIDTITWMDNGWSHWRVVKVAPRAEPCHWTTWVAPIFSEGNPSILKIKTPKPHHQSLWWTFPLAPPSPPPWPKDPLPADSRDPATSTGGNAPNFCAERCCWAFCALLGPPGPPWAALDPPGPPWAPLRALGLPGPPPLAPLGRTLPLGLSAEETSACPSLRPRQRWELRAPALNPKR